MTGDPRTEPDDVFVPQRDGRWEYGYQCLEHVEKHNCALGCRRGMADPAAFAEFGPGGTCSILSDIAVGGEPVPEITDLGDRLLCTAREPIEVHRA